MEPDVAAVPANEDLARPAERTALSKLSPRWLLGICAIWALLSILAFFPGYMSIDSVAQLTQARAHALTDWHPPVMAWLWGWLDVLWPGPAGMLILHCTLFWGALGLWAFSCFETATGLWILLALGLTPSVFGLLGTIWKDVEMGVCLTMAFALILRFERTGRWPALLLAVPCLFWAMAVRHNGIFAVIPLAVWAAYALP